jgi:nifR3 family TIM-barrel protein
MSDFWKRLKEEKPQGILVLAPMADVTDAAFRRIIAKYGKPDVLWTEFVSADGLARAPEEGRKKLLLDLMYSEEERPIVAQFFTSKPEYMREAARLARELGFDGVDINMGCPDKGVEKQGAGAALIKSPKLARELIRAAKEGAQGLPVSVKTRVGFNQVELETWLPELLAEEPAVITLHARTRKEMSKVPARWEFVKRAVEMRDELGKSTLIFGNGDVVDTDDARRKCAETGADGVMLGRAIFGTPWLFSSLRGHWNEPGVRLPILVEHTKLFEELLGEVKSFALMKKHFKSYLKGLDTSPGSASIHELKDKLMGCESASEVEEVVKSFLS